MATLKKGYDVFVSKNICAVGAIKHKIPLLDRRGAEPDERSESDEAGWWN